MNKYINYYECLCGHRWSDMWDCQPDDDCPVCGKRHITVHHSIEVPEWDSPAKPENPSRIVISIDGGLVSEVLSDNECSVIIVDSDILDEDELTEVPQTDGSTEPRYVRKERVNVDPDRVDSIFNLDIP